MNRQSTTGESSPAKREAADSAESRMGRSFPLGAEVVNGGVNFSVFSKEASLVELLLFGRVEDERPSRIIPLDSTAQRTWHYWTPSFLGLPPGRSTVIAREALSLHPKGCGSMARSCFWIRTRSVSPCRLAAAGSLPACRVTTLRRPIAAWWRAAVPMIGPAINHRVRR